MAGVTLVRRKQQLDLLAEACATQADATVTLVSPGGADVLAGRLAGWDGTGVRIDLPGLDDGPTPADASVKPRRPTAGDRATVFFAARGARFWFRAVIRSVDGRTLYVARPLHVEAERRCETQRVSLGGAPPTFGTFVPVEDAQARFVARLVDFSPGGLGAATRNLALLNRRVGELFWTHVPLPGEAHECDFVVRLAYARQDRGAGGVAAGWAFQPGDDCAHFQLNLARLQRFVQRHVAAPAGASVGRKHPEGEPPWK